MSTKKQRIAPKIIHGVKIERGIEIPHSATRFCRDVLNAMEIGDSILLPIQERETLRTAAIRLGIYICSRKVGSKNARVWRVASPPNNGRPSTFCPSVVTGRKSK